VVDEAARNGFGAARVVMPRARRGMILECIVADLGVLMT
jgi:hypothetical protein